MTGRVWRGTAFGGARGRTDVPRIVDWYMDGRIEIVCVIMGSLLCEGQQATVLQMPAQPKTTEEAAKLRRVDYVG